MNFWDSSAIVPLIIDLGEISAHAKSLIDKTKRMIVWWGTYIECTSALSRLEREGKVAENEAEQLFVSLEKLANSWKEVAVSPSLRECARRLLRVHPLRAADALQLASAIVFAEASGASVKFITFDSRLALAARKEGFVIAGL